MIGLFQFDFDEKTFLSGMEGDGNKLQYSFLGCGSVSYLFLFFGGLRPIEMQKIF